MGGALAHRFIAEPDDPHSLPDATLGLWQAQRFSPAIATLFQQPRPQRRRG